MEGDRIEIELVPNEGGTHRPSPTAISRTSSTATSAGADVADGVRAETSDPDVSSPDASSGDGSDQRRTIAIAAGVGLVALLLGWTVGRSSGADDATSAPATTADLTTPRTTADEAEADEADVDPADTIAPLDEPVAEPPLVSWPPVRRQQNATDLVANGAAIDTRPVSIDPRLDGQDVELVGLSGIDVAELDVGAGTVSEYVLDGLPRSLGSSLVAGDEWIVIPMFNGLDAFVIRDDGTVERADLAPDGSQLLHVDGTERFWRMPRAFSGGEFELEQVDLRGEPTGSTIELPTSVWPAFADPLGGVVVQSNGRWFTVGEDGSSSPLGVGEVIALDANTAVLRDCVAIDDCGLWRVDRATGTSTRVPADLGQLEARVLPAAWWNGDAGAGLSPDGRRLATTIESDTGPLGTVVIDLLTGAVVELELSRPGPPAAAWTEDGRFLILLSPVGVPTAYSVESGETFSVVAADSPTGWNTLTTRP